MRLIACRNLSRFGAEAGGYSSWWGRLAAACGYVSSGVVRSFDAASQRYVLH